MADVQRTVLIRHSAEQMYELVTNVADYPKFLPWCGGVDIRRQDEHGMEVRIDIHFGGIKQYFATRNVHQRPTRIDMAFVDGPFRQLTGHWQFTPLRADACRIDFALHYEFSNFFLEKIIEPVFHHIASTFVDSFVKRADEYYGQ